MIQDAHEGRREFAKWAYPGNSSIVLSTLYSHRRWYIDESMTQGGVQFSQDLFLILDLFLFFSKIHRATSFMECLPEGKPSSR